MTNQWDESSFNEQTITDVETARLALRWSLDKIRALQEDLLKTKQDFQEKSGQIGFLENQLKSKNAEIEKILRSHDEELKSKENSLEYQFRAKLERLENREKEVEEKIAKYEEAFRQKENRLAQDYQAKSDELRGRWAQMESELWQLRQEQVLKQQEFEKLYASKIDEEKERLNGETENMRSALEKDYQTRFNELEKREHTLQEELKKQEAVFKWAKDSWQNDVAEREKTLKQKELDVEKKLLEKNQEIDDAKLKIELLEKQIRELPEVIKKRDDEIERYRSAMQSLEGVIRSLEDEKRNIQQVFKEKTSGLEEALESERSRYKELEIEIPKRLKIAVEHERNRYHERLNEIELNYKQDISRKQEEIDHLERNLKTFEEALKTVTTERDAFSTKIEQLQAQQTIKSEEFSFREKQMRSEFEVRLKVEIEKHTQAIRQELETAQRIYEDNLRLKIEEISHLRREIEMLAVERTELLEQARNLKKEITQLNEKHEHDLNDVRVELKDGFNQRLESEKQGLRNEFGHQIENLNSILSHREKEIERLNLFVQKLEEEKKRIILETQERDRSELELQAGGFQTTIKMYEEKINHLNKAIDAMKLEKEEIILLERDRLERLYLEREKEFETRLSAKQAEAARSREEIIRIEKDRERQEESYRKSLEDLRNKFVETVGNLEEAKRISEERQKQVSALQFEFVELKKQFNEET
ncbi:MAG: hypothetical protein HY746_08165, partial [Elusimicrobia bacterium]|nr:hypothetical protein [Elusimicrobiota bacterium]